jgi:hypothetical protein
MTRWQNGIHLDSGEKITFGDATEQDTAAYTQIETNYLLGRRNILINGAFDRWQRDTSQSTSEDGYYSVDRWYRDSNGQGVGTSLEQQTFAYGQTDVPGHPQFYVHLDTVTLDTQSTHYHTFGQRIEDVWRYSGDTLTLSFYAKAGSSCNIATEFVQNFGTGSSDSDITAIGVETHSLTTSWQHYHKTVTLSSVSGKDIKADNFLALNFWISAGSDFDSRTNSLGNQSVDVYLANIQLEHGSNYTDFEILPQKEIESLCNQYFEISILQNVGYMPSATTNNRHWYVQFLDRKRTEDYTVTFNSGGTCTPTIYNKVLRGFRLVYNAGDTTTTHYITGYTIDAEL